VSQGDTVNVRILEVDAERRRLSLSLKRVDDGMPVSPKPGEESAPPTIDLSEDVFSDETAQSEPESAAEVELPASEEPVEGSDEAAPAEAE
jgi:small subunit ribosomal protein S1